MKQILISLLFLLILPTLSLACLTLPRTINLENSPFFFDSFKIAGYGFSFMSADGEQRATLSCDNRDGVNTWQISMTAGQDPGEEAMKDFLIPNNFALVDTDEVPQKTRIEGFINGPSGAVASIRSFESDKYFILTCVRDPSRSTASMVVELRNRSGTLGRMEAVVRTNVRGLSAGGADETIDFASGNMANLNIGGCGVQGSDFNRGTTPGVNQ